MSTYDARMLRDREALETEFAGYALEQAHPLIREWCGDTLDGNLLSGVRRSLNFLTDAAAAERFAADINLPDIPVASYKSRLLNIGGQRLVAGIHFYSLDPTRPFVGIERASVLPGTIADWSNLKDGLAQEFVEFRPNAIWFFHPSHLPLQAPTTGADDHVLMAPARLMTDREPPRGLDRVRLTKSADIDFYPRYRALYDHIYDERPFLRGETRTETPDSLARCMAAGLLYEVHVDGQWSGVVAATRSSLAGADGVYMVDIVLAKTVRGQGLGVAVHRRFAEAVCGDDPAAIIFGTISHRNQPSRRTAARAGRIDIGGYHWIHF